MCGFETRFDSLSIALSAAIDRKQLAISFRAIQQEEIHIFGVGFVVLSKNGAHKYHAKQQQTTCRRSETSFTTTREASNFYFRTFEVVFKNDISVSLIILFGRLGCGL